MQQRHLKIEGKVQGVGYRNWFAKQAQLLGIQGYVRNLPDGSVEAYIEATSTILDQLIEQSWQGPSRAEVTAIHQNVMAEQELMTFKDFQIRR